MLVGCKPDPRTTNLLLSPFEFHLTGSRFFEKESPNSNWDFFVQEGQPDLLDWLNNHGFVEKAKSHSKFTGTYGIVGIWNHPRFQTNVQVVKDANMKTAAQKALSPFADFVYGLSKDRRETLWYIAMTASEIGSGVIRHELLGSRS